MNPITVKYEQDPTAKWWTATVPSEPAVVTQGKTLAEAFKHVRSALALVREEEESALVLMGGETVWSERSALSNEDLQIVKKEADLRVRLLETKIELDRVTTDAVRVLSLEKQLSYGRVGLLLGITRQRVEQIVQRMRLDAISEDGSESEENVRTHART